MIPGELTRDAAALRRRGFDFELVESNARIHVSTS